MQKGFFPSKTDLQHFGGKANHFGQLIQRGLSETQVFYDCERAGRHSSPQLCQALLTAMKFWRDLAAIWEKGDIAANQYPIISRHSLRERPERVLAICTDASGPDGIGGYWGDLATRHPSFYCQQWELEGLHSNSRNGILKSSALM